MDGAKAEDRQHRRGDEDQGRDASVIPLPFGVAVVGDTVEATRAGRNALKVDWNTSAAKAAPFDSEKAKERIRPARARIPNVEAKEWYKVGDADKALAGAAKVLEADLLVRAHLPRPDGADERRRQGLRRRPVGGDLGRHAGAAARRARWSPAC